MKIVLIGAKGTIGKHVKELLTNEKHEVISVGRTSGDFQVNIECAESVATLYKRIGAFDAVVNASGDVAFAPLSDLQADQWKTSLNSKLMGQINLVMQALPYIRERGSFTLVSGIVGEENIQAGVAAATINGALEAFVRAASLELPKNLRINIVSPTVLTDSLESYGPFFPGFVPVCGKLVAQAYKKSISGIQTGAVIKAR